MSADSPTLNSSCPRSSPLTADNAIKTRFDNNLVLDLSNLLYVNNITSQFVTHSPYKQYDPQAPEINCLRVSSSAGC